MPETHAESFWCVLELMGHVRIAGRVSEEERFGTKLGRIDIPADGDKFITQYFSGSSIYRLTPCDEATARAVAVHCTPTPIHRYEMPQLAHTSVAAPVSERTMDCGHTPEDCDCDPDDDENDRPF